jgi:hypothetical protein
MSLSPAGLLGHHHQHGKSSAGKKQKDDKSTGGIKFNSKTLEYSYFSNFFPHVVHNTLRDHGKPVKEIIVKLVVPSPVTTAAHIHTETVVDCNSLEAAYMLGKYLQYVDPTYGSEVILPKVANTEAKVIKSLGSKGKYVLWKASRGMSKAAAARLYDSKQPAFRADNLKLMTTLLWSKFTLNQSLKDALLATGTQKLHEVGRPSIWTSSGSDGLGKLIGHVRSHLQRGTTNLDDVLADIPKIVQMAEEDEV